MLIYLITLRRKLKTVKFRKSIIIINRKSHAIIFTLQANKNRSDSQFCLRVEDVAHLELNGTENMYMNTTDLQKLVTTLRQDNQPNFQATKPIKQTYDDHIYEMPYESDLKAFKRPTEPPPPVPRIALQTEDSQTLRKAPSPPTEKELVPSSEAEQPDVVILKPAVPSQKSKPKLIGMKPPNTKPVLQVHMRKSSNLPLLNVNLKREQDSGYPTPDTALSFLPESQEQTPTELEPTLMSVSARKAFIEKAIAKSSH